SSGVDAAHRAGQGGGKQVGGGLHTNDDGLQRLSGTLRPSTESIDDATQASPPSVVAGRSTAHVQDLIRQSSQAAAGMSDGVEQAADDVAQSGDTYRKSDEEGKDGLPSTGDAGGGR